jgi:hypothetical protein
MATSGGGRRTRAALGARQIRRSKRRLVGAAKRIQEEWDTLVDGLPNEIRRQRIEHESRKESGFDVDPYSHADSYLKRAVYAFVRGILDQRKEGFLEDAILEERFPYRPKVSFRENPFHWAFFGLRKPERDKEEHADLITRNEVMRYGRQLVYAHRHNVPTNLLVGFIYQSGGPDFVSRKALDPARREGWFTQSSL